MRKYYIILSFDVLIALLLVGIFIINSESFYNYIYLFLFNVFTVIPLFYFIITLLDLFSKRKIKYYFLSIITPVAILLASLLIESVRSIAGKMDFTNFSASFFSGSFRIMLTLIGFGILMFIKWIKNLVKKSAEQS